MTHAQAVADLERSDAYAACGECPKGECDGCDFCDYFVEYAAWLRAGAVGCGPSLPTGNPRPRPEGER